jgi:hypothetical protein
VELSNKRSKVIAPFAAAQAINTTNIDTAFPKMRKQKTHFFAFFCKNQCNTSPYPSCSSFFLQQPARTTTQHLYKEMGSVPADA